MVSMYVRRWIAASEAEIKLRTSIEFSERSLRGLGVGHETEYTMSIPGIYKGIPAKLSHAHGKRIIVSLRNLSISDRSLHI